MNKFKKGDKVIINRSGEPRINGTIVEVLEGQFASISSIVRYKVKLEDGNNQVVYKSELLSADYINYFFCPVCAKKFSIKDAVIKRYIINKSINLDNAAMPGWMKISASADCCYIRVCTQCEAATITNEMFVRACSGNALEHRKGKIRAAENSGCMVLIGSIITVLSAACWILFLIF